MFGSLNLWFEAVEVRCILLCDITIDIFPAKGRAYTYKTRKSVNYLFAGTCVDLAIFPSLPVVDL